jgi:hypothetical protein
MIIYLLFVLKLERDSVANVLQTLDERAKLCLLVIGLVGRRREISSDGF